MAIATSLIAAGIGAAGAVGAAAMSSNASKKAAQATAQANDAAVGFQRDALQQTRVDSAPFLQAGQTALYKYMDELGLSRPTNPVLFNPDAGPIGGTYGDGQGQTNAFASLTPGGPGMTQSRGFTATPGYQYQVNEAETGVMNRLNALGLMGSGAALKELTKVRSGLAGAEYGNYLNRISSLAGMGQTATNQQAAREMTTAQNVGAVTLNTGQNRASSMLAQQGAWNNALGQLTAPAGPVVNAFNGMNWGGGFGNNAGSSPYVAYPTGMIY